MFKPKFQLSNKIAQGLIKIDTAKAEFGQRKTNPVFSLELRQKAADKMGLSLVIVEQIRKQAGKNTAIDEQCLFDLRALVLGKTLGLESSSGYYVVQVVKRLEGEAEDIVYTVSRANTLPGLMRDFIAWLTAQIALNGNGTGLHPALLAGITQREILALHPFESGNNETALCLSYFLLCRSGFDFNGFLFLKNCDDNKLLGIEKSYRYEPIDLTAWLEYFIANLQAETEALMINMANIAKPTDVESELSQTAELQQSQGLPDVPQKFDLTDKQQKIVNCISQNGRITASLAAQALKCPKRTAQLELQKLKILKTIAQKGKGPATFYQLS